MLYEFGGHPWLPGPLFVLVLVSVSVVKAFSTRGPHVRNSASGVQEHTYPYSARVWLLEACLLLVANAIWQLRAFRVVFDMSEQYRLKMRTVSPRVSGLHPTWFGTVALGGRPLDLKDAQYHGFFDSLPLLLGLMCVYLSVGWAVRHFTRNLPVRRRVKARAVYGLVFALCAAIVFHEFDTLKLLALVCGHFVLTQSLVNNSWWRPRLPAVVWISSIVILYCNDRYRGYRWVDLFGTVVSPDTPIWMWLKWMDGKHGDIAWHSSFNLVVLRCLSYSMDLWWSLPEQRAASGTGREVGLKASRVFLASEEECVETTETNKILALGERERVADYHPPDIYQDAVLYLAYLLYLPLYIAGPTLTFNSFCSQLAVPQRTYSIRDKAAYAALRFGLPMLGFYLFSHVLYTGAVAFMAFRYKVQQEPLIRYLARDDDSSEAGLDAEKVIFYSYHALNFLYLKFLLIWRLFRLWAVCDDVVPVENMERCITNSSTVGAFWRSWHRSFNRWLLRYVYFPLGGSKKGPARQALNVGIVFTFVSFWHDINMQLFAWGWLFALFFLPEIVARRVAALTPVRSTLESRPILATWVESVCVGASIFMLMVANVVGYSIGLEGLDLLPAMVNSTRGKLMVVQWFLITVGLGQTSRFLRDTRHEPLVPPKHKTT